MMIDHFYTRYVRQQLLGLGTIHTRTNISKMTSRKEALYITCALPVKIQSVK